MSLTIRDLNVSIGEKHILKQIDLTIGDGEFFSLLGNSGCGKSTLLKTIAGLIQEQSGEMILNGRELHTLPPQKRGVVVVFQDLRLFTNMTVEENVAFALKNKGVSKNERKRVASELLQKVQLEGFGGRHINQLSGGQLQRVALARALAAEPQLLLLDEPFSALDENLRDDMRKLVLDIQRETRTTTVLVTHDQREALMMSDRLAVMSDGAVIQVGRPEEIYTRPRTLDIAAYFADGDILEGRVEQGVFRSGRIVIPADRADGACTAVVRTAAIRLCPGNDFRVEEVQYVGRGYHICAAQGESRLHCEIPPGQAVSVGDRVSLEIDPARILFFDLRRKGNKYETIKKLMTRS